MNELPLWRVTYAIPTELRVIGVVRAATGLDAIDAIEQQEENLGRGPVIREATDVEQVYESSE
ncbi:hypothetical protein O7626_40290 [Micromonospora sp. WMMD1102]|uniref:hypothetical protein n=1 Tax=Micromonospora sp. WMMD1102 TaxID=3016105 RepID=UPI00241555E3|nr:hypothetical protein [Micromonospora sp. WMMD1102]MDG4792058.1 hypothetical protein [Micromonospora sp. WMMD1102]